MTTLPFSFLKKTSINPISLGQPAFYLQSFDTSFYNSGSIANGAAVVNVQRFSDSGLNFTRTNTTANAIYKVLSGQPHPYGYMSWEGNTLGSGMYSGGTTSDFSFMHQQGGEYTLYFVFKNLQNEATGATKVVAATSNSTGNRGFLFYISNGTGTTRVLNMAVRNDTSGQNVMTLSFPSFDTSIDHPVCVYSIRYKDPGNLTDIAARGYKNGVLEASIDLAYSLSATAASYSTLRIGNRFANDLRFAGYMGELIIFNSMHSEATHTGVVDFLKQKWKV